MEELIAHIKTIEHGFKHIEEAGNRIVADTTRNHFNLAIDFLKEDSYQVRMLATHLLGLLSTHNAKALHVLETTVADDKDWRVQEMLAKAFDYYCQSTGYEESLPLIKKWLTDKRDNVKRAAIEGLRIWTARPYFKEHPQMAIQLISQHKTADSEYLRRSVGNALRDIGKKHADLVQKEIARWDLNDKKTAFTCKLAKAR